MADDSGVIDSAANHLTIIDDSALAGPDNIARLGPDTIRATILETFRQYVVHLRRLGLDRRPARMMSWKAVAQKLGISVHRLRTRMAMADEQVEVRSRKLSD